MWVSLLGKANGKDFIPKSSGNSNGSYLQELVSVQQTKIKMKAKNTKLKKKIKRNFSCSCHWWKIVRHDYGVNDLKTRKF